MNVFGLKSILINERILIQIDVTCQLFSFSKYISYHMPFQTLGCVLDLDRPKEKRLSSFFISVSSKQKKVKNIRKIKKIKEMKNINEKMNQDHNFQSQLFRRSLVSLLCTIARNKVCHYGRDGDSGPPVHRQ